MTALRALLDEGARFSATYKAGLSSHLPMALIALDALGAPAARLEAFAARYAERLEPASDEERASARRVEVELARDGVEVVLARRLPALLPGVAGGAFHPLIRLAYGLEADHAGEVAAALAYWERASLPVPAAAPGGDSLEVELDALAAAAGGRAEGTSIFRRIERVAARPAFRPRMPEGLSLDEVRELFARVYLASDNDFTCLHLVTATHAWRVVHARLPLDAGLPGFVAAAAAAWITAGAPRPAPRGDAPEAPGWAALTSAAVASADDHTIKLVYTCRAEAADAGADALWRAVAARRVR